MTFRKLLPQQKTMDPDAFADAMNKDSSQCCKRKKGSDSPKKRKIAVVNDSDNESNDSNLNRRKKKKKKSGAVDSDSDAASVDSERSSKRKRATIPPLAAKPAAVATPKANSVTVAQVKAVSSITKNPNIQVKKVSANQSTLARKSTPQSAPPKQLPQLHQTAEVATGSSSVTETAEIDCTPDLFAFLVNKAYEQNVGSTAEQTAENSVTSSTSTPSTPSTPSARAPPQPSASVAVPANSITSDANSMVDVPSAASPRQYVRRVQRIQGQNDTAPVIHNYNGQQWFQFD